MVGVNGLIFLNVISILVFRKGPHIRQHVALVALDLQAVAATFLHYQFAGLPLAMERISRDGDAANIKHLDQFAQGQNLPTALGAFSDPKRQTRTMREGGHDVHI